MPSNYPLNFGFIRFKCHAALRDSRRSFFMETFQVGQMGWLQYVVAVIRNTVFNYYIWYLRYFQESRRVRFIFERTGVCPEGWCSFFPKGDVQIWKIDSSEGWCSKHIKSPPGRLPRNEFSLLGNIPGGLLFLCIRFLRRHRQLWFLSALRAIIDIADTSCWSAGSDHLAVAWTR